jgi:hypothetical protein
MNRSFVLLIVFVSLLALCCSRRPYPVDIKLGTSVDSFHSIINEAGYKIDSAYSIYSIRKEHISGFRIVNVEKPGEALFRFDHGVLSVFAWISGNLQKNPRGRGNPGLNDYLELVSWGRSHYGAPSDSTYLPPSLRDSTNTRNALIVVRWGNKNQQGEKLNISFIKDKGSLRLYNYYSHAVLDSNSTEH